MTDELGQLVAVRSHLGPRGLGAERHGAVGAALAGRRCGTVRPAAVSSRGDLGEPGAEVGERLVLAAGVRLRRCSASQAARTRSSSVTP